MKKVFKFNRWEGQKAFRKLHNKRGIRVSFANFRDHLCHLMHPKIRFKTRYYFANTNRKPLFLLTFLILALFFTKPASAQFCANPSSSDDINVSASIQQTNTYSNGKRAFVFTAVSGYTYIFSTCTTTTGDTKLRLYSTATGGTELAVSDNDCGANGKQSEITWTCPANGDYSVLLTKKNCKNLNFSAFLDYHFIMPDPCGGLSLTVNAGLDISLCSGSIANLTGSSNTDYDPVTYSHCGSTGNMDFSTSNTFVSFNGETSFSNATAKLAAYTDYSSSIFAEVIAGQTYTEALTLKINSSGDWTIAGKAWIDWNGNDQFEASEAYDLGTTTNATDGMTTLSPLAITVPASASTGYVKMRISSRWDNPSTECETDFDGEVEDYSILVISPVTYSWSPVNDLDDPTLATPSTSATTNTTYTLTATNSNGCSQSSDMTTSIVAPAVITSQEINTDNSTCGIISMQVSTDGLNGSGVWSHTNGLGVFDAPADAITQYTTNTFNQTQILSWTTNSGACAGSEANITAIFNQPLTSSISSDLNAGTSWLWDGLTSNVYSAPENWYKWDGSKWLIETSSIPEPNHDIFVLPNSTAGICVSDINFLLASGDINTIQIASGGTTTLAGAIDLTGNLINDGTVNGGTSSITLNGNADQTISGSGSFTFDDFTINKSASDLILSSPITIDGILTMTSGNMINANEIITIGTSSASPGSILYSSGIITGKLRRYLSNGNGATLFPIGNSTNLRDVSIDIQGSPGTDQYLTAAFVSGCPQGQSGDLTTGLPLNSSDGQLVENYKTEGHWEISPTNDDYSSQINSKSYTIDLHMNNFTGMNDFSQMRIIKCSGSNIQSEDHISWASITHVSSTGSNGDFMVSATTTGFSFFAAGGDDNGSLPVELSSFNGNCVDNGVKLIWETESEYNSSHFFIEYSRNGEEWSIIDNQGAALNSTEHIIYEFIHLNAHLGDNYYRLSQVDIDGTTKTYNIINVNCENLTSSYFKIYPNPSNGNIHLILNDQRIMGDATIRMIDTKGNIVLKKLIEVKNGINMYILDEELAAGIYYINILNGENSTTIVKHSIL